MVNKVRSKNLIQKDKYIQRTILIAYLIFCLYYCYRYILKYNSDGTSPTYTDTPFEFQVAKYIIAAILIFLLFLILLINEVKIKFGKIEVALFFTFVLLFIKSVYFSEFDFVFKLILFLAVAYFVVFIENDNFETKLVKVNKIVFIYHLIYSLVQMFLYVVFDRLPALGYESSLVRFGGGWDDPNAFAVYLVIPYVFAALDLFNRKEKPVKKIPKYLIIISIIFLEIMTFSFMGYFCFLVATIFIAVRFFRKNQMFFLVCAALTLLTGLLLLDKIIDVFILKSESIAIHLSHLLLSFGGENKLVGFFFGNSEFVINENFYNMIMCNFGIIPLCLIFGLCVSFVYISYKVYKENPNNDINYIMFIFITIISVCQIGLPYLNIFPINFIYFLSVFWMLNKYRRKSKQLKAISKYDNTKKINDLKV